MVRLCLSALLLGTAAGVAAQVPASAPLSPRAAEIFQHDAVLLAWALQLFDSNLDGDISLAEAQPAVRQFKIIADSDKDGRVTTFEFDRAREFIEARY